MNLAGKITSQINNKVTQAVNEMYSKSAKWTTEATATSSYWSVSLMHLSPMLHFYTPENVRNQTFNVSSLIFLFLL